MLDELFDQYGQWWGRYQAMWRRCNALGMQAAWRKMEQLRKQINAEMGV